MIATFVLLAALSPFTGNTFASLVEAERTFARTAGEKSTRDAFVAFAADDGIVFNPDPTLAKPLWEARTAGKNRLDWDPEFAMIAPAGDLGFTSGPWKFIQAGKTEIAAHGNYCTVWKVQKDGAWKFELDLGNQEDGEMTTVTPFKVTDEPKLTDAKSEAEVKSALQQLRSFDQELGEEGETAEIASLFEEGAPFYLPTGRPFIGPGGASKALSGYDSFKTEPLGGDMSVGGDFAYTFGKGELVTKSKQPTAIYYSRVWRKIEGKWKLVAGVVATAARG